jgi:protein FRA10AC1
MFQYLEQCSDPRYNISLVNTYCRYAIIDLARANDGIVGMRWRTKNEVVQGKGQSICGSTTCSSRESLHSYEVPFQYVEANQTKAELVKVRICGDCAPSLFAYHSNAERQKGLDHKDDNQHSIDIERTRKKSKK